MANPLHSLDNYVHEAMHAWGLPGLALAVVKDGAVLLAKGYGLREAGKPDPVDEHTLFGVGSNTKAFTATALGLLVHEGRLDWDDPAADHLPGFRLADPYVTQSLTVRDLLCHRSGLATYAGDVLFYGGYSRAQNLRRLRHVPLAYGFRARYGYSNLMFLAAGEIIPHVLGLSWDDFVRQRLFAPLGMARSTPGTAALAGLPNLAVPHTWIDGRLAAIPRVPADNVGPAASIYASAWDMAQWLLLQLGGGALAGRQIVPPEIIHETRAAHTPIPLDAVTRRLFPWQHFAAYGLGWFLSGYRGRLLISHGGHVEGMLSRSAFLPAENLGVVVLTNDERNALQNALVCRVLDLFLDGPVQDWSAVYLQEEQAARARAAEAARRAEAARIKNTRPSLPLEALLGRYAHPILGQTRVYEEDGRLHFQAADHPLLGGDLRHWHYDTFQCRWKQNGFGSTFLTFLPDGAGQVGALRVKFRDDWIDPVDYLCDRP